MSNQFSSGKTVGVAFITDDKKYHRGLAITKRFRKQLDKKLKNSANGAQLYAILIFLLLKDNPFAGGFADIEELIICNDEKFDLVSSYLRNLLSRMDFTEHINILNITEYRLRENKPKRFRSLADNIANSYRRRAMNPLKHNKGIHLNVVNISLAEIYRYWE